MRSELIRFRANTLLRSDVEELELLAKKTRLDVVNLIEAAGSGHIGGSFSSMEILVLLYVCSDITPANANSMRRDKIVVSHGHVSAALYCLLANLGFIDAQAMRREYRRVPGDFEGHPTRTCRGVDWGSGSLGHGLSVASGMAISDKFTGESHQVFAVMGDGEQAKGQLCEAMTFAKKFRLGNLTAVIDYNGMQCSGEIGAVMHIDLEKRYRAAGWEVFNCDGHSFGELYQTLRRCYHAKEPSVVIAHTVMGKGLPFIENDYRYHSGHLDAEKLAEARLLLHEESSEESSFLKHSARIGDETAGHDLPEPGLPLVYSDEEMRSCRSILGNSLVSIARVNKESSQPVVVDCDVADSTGVREYERKYPERFLQCGISEHSAVSMVGGLAACGVPVVFADLGVFSIDETYAQLRMNSLNGVNAKIIATHCGLDVGEDGKTHQCIDYISLASGLLDAELLIPADVNQTDHMLRYLVSSERPGILVVGRTKKKAVTDTSGTPFYGKDYKFEYGKADWLVPARDVTIITCGNMVSHAIEAARCLREEHILCGVLNVGCPKQLDAAALDEAVRSGAILVYEDHNALGGLGGLIALHLAEKGVKCKFREIGITRYGGSADPDKLYAMQRMDVTSVVKTVVSLVNEGRQETVRA